MTALDAAKRLAAKGLGYWAPGPVEATLWALDDDNTPQLVAPDGGPVSKALRERYHRIDEAAATEGAQWVYWGGAYLWGVAAPVGADHTHHRYGQYATYGPYEEPATGCWDVIPFAPSENCLHVNADGKVETNRKWYPFTPSELGPLRWEGKP